MIFFRISRQISEKSDVCRSSINFAKTNLKIAEISEIRENYSQYSFQTDPNSILFNTRSSFQTDPISILDPLFNTRFNITIVSLHTPQCGSSICRSTAARPRRPVPLPAAGRLAGTFRPLRNEQSPRLPEDLRSPLPATVARVGCGSSSADPAVIAAAINGAKPAPKRRGLGH